jgi:hypothetical protein
MGRSSRPPREGREPSRWLSLVICLSYIEAGPGDDGNIDGMVKRLTDQEARSIADEIVSLVFSEMRRIEEE